MNISHFSYLFFIVFTVGFLVAAEWYRNKKVLKKYELFLILLMILGALGASSEYFALKWQVWSFSIEKSLNIKFGAELETYLYGILGTLLISIITIVYASKIDQRKTKQRKLKPGKFFRDAGAARR